ncbi:hypothetical protein [Vulcanisaeta distributa]|uniref:hypothetical protein n=1 Tax=Vulcanisaeta distributa TaxID=164451 RepID=UPI001FB505B5|nr:hypothetical protein [Vulcanisaeta distributa]
MKEREVITTALVNTGFETERPQVLVPLNLAMRYNGITDNIAGLLIVGYHGYLH